MILLLKMLPIWNPSRVVDKIPFNLSLCGGRRQGKSTACSDLLLQMKDKFSLVISFVGSAACNPVLARMQEKYWDPRFFFSEWKGDMVDALLRQQEALKLQGVTRHVCILVDDVVLTSSAEEQLAHMAMRGRHFNISLMMCSVSYTTLPKRVRRSLDVLLVFSCPMTGDLKILTWEFASRAKMAEYALRNLADHECLVMETLQKKQELFIWKASEVTLDSLNSKQKNQELPDPSESKTPAVRETPSACREPPPLSGTADYQDHI